MHITRPQSNQPLPPHAKKVFEGEIFSVFQWEQEMFDGTKEIFEKIGRRDTVGVIAITKDKKILITHQEQPSMKPFIGTPGGIIDKGEDPFTAAQRELLEETGYRSDNWEVVLAVQPTTKIEWAIYIFVAKDCEKTQAPRLDPGEKMRTEEITWDGFVQLMSDTNFRDKELALFFLRAQAKGQLQQIRQQFGLFG